MPDLSAKLGLELPKGNETVNREAYIRNLNILDQKAAAQSQVNEPFNLLNAVYDAGGNKIDITFGPGRVTFLDVLVAKTENSAYSIEAPQSNTSYYVYIKDDGSFTHNTTAGNVTGAALIWKVATGSPVSYISIEDRRGRMSGTDAQAVVDYVNARIIASDPLGVPKPYFSDILPMFYLWCNGKTIGDGSSGASARANTDTHDLFVVLWRATGLRIYESTGALSARGASAEADWASHKRLALPNIDDRFLRGPQANREIGSLQGDAIRNITGTFNNGIGVSDYGATGAFEARGYIGYNSRGTSTFDAGRVYSFAFDASRVVPTADETRPKNIACNFIMRY